MFAWTIICKCSVGFPLLPTNLFLSLPDSGKPSSVPRFAPGMIEMCPPFVGI